MYKNQSYLKLRKPQLFSVGKGCERGNRNVRFLSTRRVVIKIPSAAGNHRCITVEVKFGVGYLGIIESLIESDVPYSAGVYLKNGGWNCM